jgi:hypothetical protein
VRLTGQEGCRPALLGIDELVGDEDVVRSCPNHHDRLPDRCGADAERPVLQLEPGDVGALVVLDVATEASMELGQVRLHERQVGDQDVAVDDQCRGHDIVPAPADRRAVLVADAVVGLGDERRRFAHQAWSPSGRC